MIVWTAVCQGWHTNLLTCSSNPAARYKVGPHNNANDAQIHTRSPRLADLFRMFQQKFPLPADGIITSLDASIIRGNTAVDVITSVIFSLKQIRSQNRWKGAKRCATPHSYIPPPSHFFQNNFDNLLLTDQNAGSIDERSCGHSDAVSADINCTMLIDHNTK